MIGNEVTNVFDAVMKKLPDLGEGEAVEITAVTIGSPPKRLAAAKPTKTGKK